MKRYQVIGGQYVHTWYGESNSLTEAKRIATKHTEYWDNWQGFQTPRIYLASDVIEDEDKWGMTRYPDPRADPIAYKVRGKWITTKEE